LPRKTEGEKFKAVDDFFVIKGEHFLTAERGYVKAMKGKDSHLSGRINHHGSSGGGKRGLCHQNDRDRREGNGGVKKTWKPRGLYIMGGRDGNIFDGGTYKKGKEGRANLRSEEAEKKMKCWGKDSLDLMSKKLLPVRRESTRCG